LSAAYLRSQLYPGDLSWQSAQAGFTIGTIESK
jgi:hypothetical protein